jgi:isopenicillin N synthase-like dioxygenase
MSFSVPTIDVSSYISDPSSAAAKDSIDAIRAACLNTGFFQVIGHGIPKETQKGILRAAKNLYDLPMEEKRKLDYTKNIGHKGYAIIGSQGYDDELLPDLKEVCMPMSSFSVVYFMLKIYGWEM